jgi:hypothetical protein
MMTTPTAENRDQEKAPARWAARPEAVPRGRNRLLAVMLVSVPICIFLFVIALVLVLHDMEAHHVVAHL